MLRINLLPPYIYDKQKKIKWIVAAAGIFAATLGVLLWWFSMEQAQLADANKRNEEANTQKSAYDNKVSAIKAEQDKVAVTKAKQTFVSNAITYNDAWPATYAQMRDITTPKVLLKHMSIADDHKTINFSGFCVYEEDLVRWWMFLRSTQLFSTVHFNLPEHPWPPKASNASGGGGSPGSSGYPGGFGSSGGASFGPTGSGASSYPGGGAGFTSAGGFGSGGSSFGGGSFGGGGGGDAVGDEEIEGRKGIKFTGTATLKTALAGGIPVPVWPPGGGGTPAGGPGGPIGPSSMPGGGGAPFSSPPNSAGGSGAPGGRGGGAAAGRQD